MRIIRGCTIVGTVLCVVGLSIMWFQEPFTEEKHTFMVTFSKKEYLGTYPLKEIVEEPDIEESLESYSGFLSGYGPDCYGCTSLHTASGYYVGDGNIYYEDETYGQIRIVAGDKSYPFGTIVKLQNTEIDPFYAIVLDRGSAIGKDKKIQFDLLFPSEKDTVVFGLNEVQVDVLRLGY